MPHALVLGAGIGGLAAAVALGDRGWSVTVLERAPVLEPVGAGIGVAPNGLRALDALGLGDAVRARRSWDGAGGLRTPSGRWLARTTQDAAAERFGDPIVLLTRSALVELLRSRLPDGVTLRTGVRATVTDPGADDRRATVGLVSVDAPLDAPVDAAEDGVSADGAEGTAGGAGVPETLGADLVVAADGIHSATRRALFPAHPAPRYAGFTTWRFVTEAPAGRFAPHETWGRGRIWGTQPLPDGRVYAYASAVAPAGHRAPGGERELLGRLFGRWHAPLPELIGALPEASVIRTDVHHMTDPLPAHHRGRTVLLGDAAHAMAPNIGQGGNQALEDAVVLGRFAGPSDDVVAAAAAYTAERLPRTTAVVRRAARAARMTTLTSVPACLLRNTALAAAARTPQAALRAMDGIADWRPPPRT